MNTSEGVLDVNGFDFGGNQQQDEGTLFRAIVPSQIFTGIKRKNRFTRQLLIKRLLLITNQYLF